MSQCCCVATETPRRSQIYSSNKDKHSHSAQHNSRDALVFSTLINLNGVHSQLLIIHLLSRHKCDHLYLHAHETVSTRAEKCAKSRIPLSDEGNLL